MESEAFDTATILNRLHTYPHWSVSVWSMLQVKDSIIIEHKPTDISRAALNCTHPNTHTLRHDNQCKYIESDGKLVCMVVGCVQTLHVNICILSHPVDASEQMCQRGKNNVQMESIETASQTKARRKHSSEYKTHKFYYDHTIHVCCCVLCVSVRIASESIRSATPR